MFCLWVTVFTSLTTRTKSKLTNSGFNKEKTMSQDAMNHTKATHNQRFGGAKQTKPKHWSNVRGHNNQTKKEGK
jgi:hypothetical protein